MRLAAEQGYRADRLQLHAAARDVMLHTPKNRAARKFRLVELGLAGSALTLALMNLLVWHWRVGATSEAVAMEMREKLTLAKQAEPLRQEIAALKDRLELVVRDRKAAPYMTTVLGELAAALPEGTRLLDFVWSGKQGRVRLAAPPAAASRPFSASGSRLESSGMHRVGTGSDGDLMEVEIKWRER